MRFQFCKIGLGAAALVAMLHAGAALGADSPVGFTDVTVAGNTELRGDPSNRLGVVVWYPAAAGTLVAPIEVGPPATPYFVEGQGAKDAAVAAGAKALPFVVVSHGTGGTSMDLSWLCAGLAARGFIVASVDHPGNNALEPPTVAGTTLWWQRADDLSRVIEGVLATPRFGPLIDRSRIGAAGFSLGGYAVLAIAGARGDARRIEAYCTRNPGTPACDGAATPTIPDVGKEALALAAADARYAAALDANSVSHRDSRVKAVFSIAPALGPALIPESLATIDIPVALVAGFGDPILPVSDNVIPDALAIPNAQLTLFPKPIGHYTFLTDCASLGREKFAPICGDAGPRRTAVHRATLELAATFFARTLPSHAPAH